MLLLLNIRLLESYDFYDAKPVHSAGVKSCAGASTLSFWVAKRENSMLIEHFKM